jgi:cellulose biosynthesis protein BcsQ
VPSSDCNNGQKQKQLLTILDLLHIAVTSCGNVPAHQPKFSAMTLCQLSLLASDMVSAMTLSQVALRAADLEKRNSEMSLQELEKLNARRKLKAAVSVVLVSNKLQSLRKNFMQELEKLNARRKFKAAVSVIVASNKLQSLGKDFMQELEKLNARRNIWERLSCGNCGSEYMK